MARRLGRSPLSVAILRRVDRLADGIPATIVRPWRRLIASLRLWTRLPRLCTHSRIVVPLGPPARHSAECSTYSQCADYGQPKSGEQSRLCSQASDTGRCFRRRSEVCGGLPRSGLADGDQQDSAGSRRLSEAFGGVPGFAQRPAISFPTRGMQRSPSGCEWITTDQEDSAQSRQFRVCSRSNLARLYQVEVRVLNQAVKRIRVAFRATSVAARREPNL